MKTTKLALVDDHRLFRKGLLELVNGFSDYTVSLEAENGRDFIQKLHPGNIPHIVLLDISMPVMNGFETALWLEQHHPDVRVLALSMSDDEDTVLHMLRCGVNGYVLKNADPAELRMALEALQGNGTYYSGSVGDVLKRDLMGARSLLVELTEREMEFLKLACTELPYKSFAPLLDIAPRAVEAMRDSLFRKLSVASRVGLAVYAIRHGIYKVA